MALRDVVLKDFWPKAFSLALAVLIWFTVKLAISHEITLAPATGSPVVDREIPGLPVLVVSAAADVRDFRVRPSTVEVVVRGDPNVLDQLSSKDIRVTVDLTDIESARSLRKRVDVATPARVAFVRVDPPDVEIIVPPKRP